MKTNTSTATHLVSKAVKDKLSLHYEIAGPLSLLQSVGKKVVSKPLASLFDFNTAEGGFLLCCRSLFRNALLFALPLPVTTIPLELREGKSLQPKAGCPRLSIPRFLLAFRNSRRGSRKN